MKNWHRKSVSSTVFFGRGPCAVVSPGKEPFVIGITKNAKKKAIKGKINFFKWVWYYFNDK